MRKGELVIHFGVRTKWVTPSVFVRGKSYRCPEISEIFTRDTLDSIDFTEEMDRPDILSHQRTGY